MRRTIELRSGTWEWRVVDPDDPRGKARRARRAPEHARVATPGGAGAPAPRSAWADSMPEAPGAPPLPRRRLELRLADDARHCLYVAVPPHLGNAGDETAVALLALNPDRRTLVDPQDEIWLLWPVTPASPAPGGRPGGGAHLAHAVGPHGPARILTLPDGLALGQLTTREILDLVT